MSEITGKTIACPRCGNRFVWKPSLAGKKLSCTCGRIIDVEIGGEPKEAVYQTVSAAAAAGKIGDRAALYQKRTSTIVADGTTGEHAVASGCPAKGRWLWLRSA